jgi:acyl-CoA dehydrogenase
MKRNLDAARLLCWNAASLADLGKDNSKEVSMAKALSAKVAMEICVDAMEIGMRASVDDLSLFERLFRNAKVFDILEGTGEMQRLMIASSLVRGRAN